MTVTERLTGKTFKRATYLAKMAFVAAISRKLAKLAYPREAGAAAATLLRMMSSAGGRGKW